MKRTLLGFTALMLVGCPAPPANQGDMDLPGKAVLEVIPEVHAGGYTAQAEIEKYSQKHIKRLVVELIRLNSDKTVPTELDESNRFSKSVDRPGEAFQDLHDQVKALRFTGLRSNTSYQIRWYAYKSPTADHANLISKPGNITVEVMTDDAPTVATMPIQLADRPFDAKATADGITVTDGNYSYSGPEAIE